MFSLSLSVFLFGLLCCSVSAVVIRFGDASVEYSATPAGYIRSDCVHAVDGTAVQLLRDDQGQLIAHSSLLGVDGQSVSSISRVVPVCDVGVGRAPMHLPRGSVSVGAPFPPGYDGWTTYTAWNYSASVDVSLGYFSVPDTPKQLPEVLYIFTGLQNIDWIPVVDPEPTAPFDIIQPVLQYPADAGLHWSLKSWYVTLDEGAVYSSEVACKPGDNIFGNMTRTGSVGYYIGGTCSGGTTSITHSAARLLSQPWAYNTIECYSCDGCGTYPTQPITFSKLQLFAGGTQITPKWVVDPKPSKLKQCNEKSTVQDAQTVVVSFQ